MTTKLKILIVEDEADQRDVVEQILSAEGYEVYAVASAELALSELHNTNVDLVYSDWQLPGMDGLDLMLNVRELQPDIA
ncbi:MAG: response regulator, partial [Enterobacterales bacterium]|nr:response regulator [Enterobacterales bacterium]